MTRPSSNVGAGAAHKSVPEWADIRVSEECLKVYGPCGLTADEIAKVFAHYIASVEEAPVDPLLIKAAPALLAACEAWLAWADNDDLHESWFEAHKIVRAAIAKAKGGAA